MVAVSNERAFSRQSTSPFPPFLANQGNQLDKNDELATEWLLLATK
jgi:hypothetical protein